MGIVPVDAADFARAMAALGPFEQSPHIAVAVSGGGDSMALALLADQWARRRGGRVTALTVDHGLRQGSADEAVQAGCWLRRRGVEHRIIDWVGDKPASGVQAAARLARYRLMAAACRETGVLHLLIGHNREDQAETFLMRLARSSGIDGLAAMSPVVETHGVRMLRPLLDMSRDRLRAVLRALGQDWIEDPSNRNTAFTRIRIRKTLPNLAAAGLSAAALAGTAARMARVRVALETTASALLGRVALVHPTGYMRLDGRTLFEAPEEISWRALSRVLICVGGGYYPPTRQKLENLHEKMKMRVGDGGGWKGATLGHCRITPEPAGMFNIIREMRNLPDPVDPAAAVESHWDRRFDVRLRNPWKYRTHNEMTSNCNGLILAPLGRRGLLEIVAAGGGARMSRIPKPVLWTLPALFDGDGVVQAPHLNYSRPAWPTGSLAIERAAFHPAQSLSGTGFAIAE